MSQPAYSTIGYRFASVVRQRAMALGPVSLANPGTDEQVLACWATMLDSLNKLEEHNQQLHERLAVLEAATKTPVSSVVLGVSPVAETIATVRMVDELAAAARQQYADTTCPTVFTFTGAEEPAEPTADDFKLSTQVVGQKAVAVTAVVGQPAATGALTHPIHGKSYMGLSTRARTILSQMGVTHWSQLANVSFRHLIGCGEKTATELTAWNNKRNQALRAARPVVRRRRRTVAN